jgi:tyrosine-specific transport protein
MERTAVLSNFYRILSGTLLIAGTTIGAGMLGIPLVTGSAGFWPAFWVTVGCWGFMAATGLLFLEVSLWMPPGSNILSMAERFFGRRGKWVAGVMFCYLYYCLMVAYFAAGAPLLGGFLGLQGTSSYVIFGLLFGGIVAFGAKAIDRANITLVIGMAVSYFMLLGMGSSEVQMARLKPSQWSSVAIAIPVLFSAFGYHNVIPSLRTYLKGDRRSLQISIVAGSMLALIVYLLWQWLMIGAVPVETMKETLAKGLPATFALKQVTGNPFLFTVGKWFAFFALVTSMLGVAFSLVDFLGDAAHKIKRGYLCLATFIPPFIFAVLDPTIFDRALGYAGGYGEAFLNGLLPVALIWVGKYHVGLKSQLYIKKWMLRVLFAAGLFVIGLEAFLTLV